jgi:hypothetical protein
MNESTEYNGYSNYETWLVSLWLNGDQANYNALQGIKAKRFMSAHKKAEFLEELTRELYDFEPVGIVADFVKSPLSATPCLT